MAIVEFPPVNESDEHGLVALGGDLDLESLLLAYSKGIFPWPINEEYPLAWFSPDPRGILAYDKLHLSKSFRKFLKKNPYEVKFNTNFKAVILNCAEVKRVDQLSTWITKDIIDAYIELNKQGYAYSIETYLDDRLVGGVYGVCINRFYSGESMFHLQRDASKVALMHLVEHMRNLNMSLLDVQWSTPHLASLGVVEVSREEYLSQLSGAISGQ